MRTAVRIRFSKTDHVRDTKSSLSQNTKSSDHCDYVFSNRVFNIIITKYPRVLFEPSDQQTSIGSLPPVIPVCYYNIYQ